MSWGVARAQALGLEVVLADGRVLNNLNKLKKDNTGYDLKNLFIGAEGTLGVITAAALRLIPRPRSVETAFAGVASPEAALELLGIAADRSGGDVTSFELMVRLGIDAVLKHDSGARDPLAGTHPWYVLIELSSQAREGLRDTMEAILAEGVEKGLVADAAIAENLDQTKAFWRIREMFGEVQRHVGGSIKHDISVPVAHVPAFIREANAAVAKLIRRAPAAVRPSRRRQYPLQRRAAGRCRQGGVPRALARREQSGVRRGAEIRGLDFGRARHRRDEARPAAEHQGPGRARPDARAQAHARPEGHFESGESAVTYSRHSGTPPTGPASGRPDDRLRGGPGIHKPESWLWIPGSRLRRAPE